jgi:hypothetical protein
LSAREWEAKRCGSRYIMEHQMVMERILGRPLRRGETVHHKNGIRHDNVTTNLELWASCHPSGQRIVDLVAWARELLTNYAEIADRTAHDAPESTNGPRGALSYPGQP